MTEAVEKIGDYLVLITSQEDIEEIMKLDIRLGLYGYCGNHSECYGYADGLTRWNIDYLREMDTRGWSNITLFYSVSEFKDRVEIESKKLCYSTGINLEFKIGDRVKVIANHSSHDKPMGHEFTISRVREEIATHLTKYFCDEGYYYYPEDIQLCSLTEKQPDFKIGNRVRVTKRSALRSVFWNSPSMDATIGQIYTVESVYHKDKTCFLSNGWNYNFESLELVTEKEVQEEEKESRDLTDYVVQCYSEKEVVSILIRLGDLGYSWSAGQKVLDYKGWEENLKTDGCVYISPDSGYNITKSNISTGNTIIGSSKFFEITGGDPCYYLGKANDYLSVEFDLPSVEPELVKGITYPEKKGEPTTKEHDLGIKPEVKAKLDLSELKVSEHKL